MIDEDLWKHSQKLTNVLYGASKGIDVLVTDSGYSNPDYPKYLELEKEQMFRKKIYINNINDVHSAVQVTFTLTEKGWKVLSNSLYCIQQIKKNRYKLKDLRGQQNVFIALVVIWIAICLGASFFHFIWLPWYISFILLGIIGLCGIVEGIKEIHSNHRIKLLQDWIVEGSSINELR